MLALKTRLEDFGIFGHRVLADPCVLYAMDEANRYF
jgi:hypothetical protein